MITTNDRKSPKMKKVLTTHDLPNPPKKPATRNKIATTSDGGDYKDWNRLLPDEKPDHSEVPPRRMPGWNKLPWGKQ